MKKLPLILFGFLFCTIIVSGQTDVETLIKKSRELTKQNKFSEALAAVIKAVERQSDNPDLYFRRHHAFRGINNKEEAISDGKGMPPAKIIY